MKNIYKILLLLFAFFIGYVLYTLYSNKKYDGIWIVTYSIDEKYIFSEPPKIFEILNGNMITHSLDEIKDDRKNFIYTNIFHPDPNQIVILNKDSLVIEYSNSNKLVLKKIPKIYKSISNIDILNKVFLIEKNIRNEVKDTIYITENAVIYKSNKFEILPSKIKEINGFNIVLTEIFPLIFKKEKRNYSMYIPTRNKEFLEYKVTEINDSKTLKSFKMKYAEMFEKETQTEK